MCRSNCRSRQYLHDYIFNHCSYDFPVYQADGDIASPENPSKLDKYHELEEQTDSFGVYGALVKGLAVCEGYLK